MVLAAFIFIHHTPNVWFVSRTDFLTDSSNPLLVVLELGITGLAFARVAGSIDHLITMFKLETTLYLFAGMTLASTFWSVDPVETASRGIVFIAVTLFASYLVLRFSLDQIIRLLAVMFLISAMINVAFIAAFPQFGIDSDDRFTGVFPQKNALGYVAALAIPTLIVAGRAYRPGRFFAYGGVLVQLGLLIGSQSKTMLVAGLVPTALMVVYHLFRSRKTLRGAVLLSLGGSALFTVAFATANIGILAEWLDKDVTLTGRVPMWQSLIPVAIERPWLGHGYAATFGGYFSPVHELWIQARWNPSHAHNALLQIWLEIGIFAVVLFLIVYLRAVARAIKIVAIVPGAVGLWPLVFLTSTLLMSITESGMSSEFLGWMMFVVAVLSVSLHLRHRDDLGLSNDLRAATHANATGHRLPSLGPRFANKDLANKVVDGDSIRIG
ncbi:MAG: O-antigen ligase family protein [Actinomycetia bacterium]|nr:O-antigen ligase family protein [Actinomycetes bacterium]